MDTSTISEAPVHLPVPPSELREELDGSLLEMTEIPLVPLSYPVAPNKVLRKQQLAEVPREQLGTLLGLCYELFVEQWQRVMFGSCIEGAVYELQLASEPSHISYLDGYLTLYLEHASSHMHLCLGPHTGLKHYTPDELARVRRCARAAFVRTLGDNGEPHSWSIQLWNGNGEQMITFFLPSPFLDLARQKFVREPVWSHLDLWNSLRARHLGELAPQPLPLARGTGGCG